MKDLALVVALALLLLAAAGAYVLLGALARRMRPPAGPHPAWQITERSADGVTRVQLQLVGPGPDGTPMVQDVREVGSVRDLDPDYDDVLLTLRAKAQQRLAVVDRG